MKPKKTDSEQYRKQRLAAVQAAAAVFSDKGYHGASTSDIAARLGIKQGSLYYYFDSKEEALEEVCLYGLQHYVDNMNDIASTGGDFEAQLFAAVMNHLTSYLDKNEALKVFNNERLYLPKERRSRLKELGSRYRQQLEQIFEDGKAAGTVHGEFDSHFAAQSVIALCNGLGDVIVREQDADVFSLARKCTNLIINGTKRN